MLSTTQNTTEALSSQQTKHCIISIIPSNLAHVIDVLKQSTIGSSDMLCLIAQEPFVSHSEDEAILSISLFKRQLTSLLNDDATIKSLVHLIIPQSNEDGTAIPIHVFYSGNGVLDLNPLKGHQRDQLTAQHLAQYAIQTLSERKDIVDDPFVAENNGVVAQLAIATGRHPLYENYLDGRVQYAGLLEELDDYHIKSYLMTFGTNGTMADMAEVWSDPCFHKSLNDLLSP